jgi:hypothetical protein
MYYIILIEEKGEEKEGRGGGEIFELIQLIFK